MVRHRHRDHRIAGPAVTPAVGTLGWPTAAGGLRPGLGERAEIIFADEPTGNLDSRSSGEVLSFLRSSIDEQGQTIVMVTHDPSAAAYTDRVVFLADGRIVDEMHQPSADRVLDRMKTLDTVLVG